MFFRLYILIEVNSYNFKIIGIYNYVDVIITKNFLQQKNHIYTYHIKGPFYYNPSAVSEIPQKNTHDLPESIYNFINICSEPLEPPHIHSHFSLSFFNNIIHTYYRPQFTINNINKNVSEELHGLLPYWYTQRDIDHEKMDVD